jgi:hypothetical protein
LASLIFRKGLDLKHAVAGMLADNYHSGLVEQIKADDFTFKAGFVTKVRADGGAGRTASTHSRDRFRVRALSACADNAAAGDWRASARDRP